MQLALLALTLALAIQPPAPPAPPVSSPSPPRNQPALRIGEYDCYGLGTSGVLVALSFRIRDAERYSSSSGEAEGTYVIEGTKVSFRNGHLDGEVGYELRDNVFKLGGIETCRPR